MTGFAGFDTDGAAWGGQSVNFGRDFTVEAWGEQLEKVYQLGWPVVAQRVAMTTQVTLDHYLENGERATCHDGYSRLRTFFLRHDVASTAEMAHCGSHLTVTSGMNVSEQARGAIQAPVLFAK